jgi:fermentation-respiration switch protein FrsA (DUF1100 family)
MLGPGGVERWKRQGSRPFYNFVTQTERPVDFGFYEDLVPLARAPAPRVPVRLIHGRRDEVVPVALSEELARAHPERVTLTVVDDDHSLLAHKELVLDAILESVKRASRGQAPR